MNKTQKRTGPPLPSRKAGKTSDAIEIIDRSLVGDDVEFRDMIEQETVNALVAQAIYDARTSAGLTQKQLAELIDTKQPVISQLEDADYQGHSLSMLKRIATALNCRLEIRMVPNPPEPQRV
jgi:ribosome-binding protein aMBF1 (putative translation factor)